MRPLKRIGFIAAALAVAAGAHQITLTVRSNSFYPASKHGGNYMHNFYIPPAPSSTPWAPAWAPDGNSIAVSMHGSIWKVDPKTGHATEITYNKRYHSSPNYSPDGKWLVYTADENHTRIQLEILNVATGQTSALTDDKELYMDPVFSPDGNYLAYVSTQPNGYFNVYIRPIADGAWAGEAIPISRDERYARNRPYFGVWDMHMEPEWLQGGKELLILSNHEVPLGSGAIWRVPAERYGMENGRKILDEQSLFRTRPHVSIDGKRFIYSSTAGAADEFHHLYVLPVSGGYPYKMTFGDYEEFHPRWSPDGESIAFISNEGGLPQLVVMETYGGRKNKIRITGLDWKRPMGTVEVTVVDAATGKPMQARIQGAASDGKFYTPPESYSRIGHYGVPAFHIAGSYSMQLPAGTFKLQAIRGFEYWPREVEINVQAGQKQMVKVPLRRMSDLNAQGWYGGSTHTHMNYGGNFRNTLENLMYMAKSEDQDIVNELVANKDNRVLDWQYFVPGGGEHPVSKNDKETKLIVGEEYRPPFYGHVFLIGLRDYLISPFLTGYEGTGVESLYPSNTDMFLKALDQQAVTGYVHPWMGDNDPLEGDLGVAKGFPVDAVLETSKCLEWSGSSRATVKVWQHALNNDIRVTPTGGEDSMSNMHISKLIGGLRTYAYLGKDFSIPSWLSALRKGHTFYTSGPLLSLTINGKMPGDDIKLPPAGGTVNIEASVQSITPISKAYIYYNSQVWKELSLSGDHKLAMFKGPAPVTGSGWFALYAEGPRSDLLDINYVQAGTNAIRVYSGNQKIRNRESAEYFMRWIDKLQKQADAWPFWRSQMEKDHVFAQFQKARKIYEGFAQEAGNVRLPSSE